jgi:hypothetical protein
MATPPAKPGSRKGIPNRATTAGRDLALLWGPDAMRKLAALAGLIRDPDGNVIGMAENETVQMNSCLAIVNRAYGMPTQLIAGDPENPLRTQLKVVFVDPPRRELDRRSEQVIDASPTSV